jgi:hypothetical protein
MKSGIKSLAAVVLCLGVAINALAAAETIPERKIVKMQVYAKGAAIQYSPSYANSQGCAGSAANSIVFIDLTATPELKVAIGSALAAYMAGKQVGFGINGCYAGYGDGIPTVYRVDIQD